MTGEPAIATAVYQTQCSCRQCQVFLAETPLPPCSDCGQPTTWRVLRPQPPSSEEPPRSRSVVKTLRRVLLVESDDQVAEAVERLLVGEPIELRRVRSRAEACSTAAVEAFDVAIVNAVLSDGCGITLGEALLHHRRSRSIVSLVPRTASADYRLRALGLGMVMTGSSPPEALLNAILAVPAA